MKQFHQDGINWGDFSIRKTLYNPDLHRNPDRLSNIQPDRFFNIPISELKNRFNRQTAQHRSRYVYQPQHHSFLVNTVHEFCQKAGIPMLSVVLFRTPKIGASTYPGTEIDISAGACHQLSKAELKALLAHEVAHNVIYTKHLNLPNEEGTADVMGARLSSEKSMIHLLKYFARHVTANQAAAGDQEHESDRARINKLKRAFHRYHTKELQIYQLKQKLSATHQQNQKLRDQFKIRQQKRAVVKKLQKEIRTTARQNHNQFYR